MESRAARGVNFAETGNVAEGANRAARVFCGAGELENCADRAAPAMASSRTTRAAQFATSAASECSANET